MLRRILKKILNEKISLSLLFFGFLILIVGFLMFLFREEIDFNAKLNSEKVGQFGDFIGGVAGSLWTLASIILFYVALTDQREDVKINRKALKTQIKALKKQIQEFELQREELIETRKVLKEQNKLQKKSNRNAILIDLFNEFRNTKWTEIRKKISESKKNRKPLKFEDVKEYSHFLNHFGFLLKNEYVEVKPLYEMFGRNVMEFWDIYKEDIEKERSYSDSWREYRPYQYHLESLSAQMRLYFKEGRENINLVIKTSRSTNENRE